MNRYDQIQLQIKLENIVKYVLTITAFMFVGYLASDVLLSFLPHVLALFGISLVKFAFFVGTLYGGRRFLWRTRFWLVGHLMMMVSMFLFIDGQVNGSLPFAQFMDQLLQSNNQAILYFLKTSFGVNIFGACVHVVLNTLYEFQHNLAPGSTAWGKPGFSEKQRKQSKKDHQERPSPQQHGPNVQEALDLFELKTPITAAQLKKRRGELLKKVHPDTGGSNYMTRLVNQAYDTLKPLC